MKSTNQNNNHGTQKPDNLVSALPNNPAALLYRARSTSSLSTSPPGSAANSPKAGPAFYPKRVFSFEGMTPQFSPSNNSVASAGLPKSPSWTDLSLGATSFARTPPSSVSSSNTGLLFVPEESASAVKINELSYMPLEFEYFATHSAFDNTYITGFTKDFFDRLLCTTQENYILISYRLQADPYKKPTRRSSYGDKSGFVLSSPKDPRTQTTSNPYDTVCYGHIPRDAKFRFYPYNAQDDLFCGAFPKNSMPASSEFLAHLQQHAENGSLIAEAREFENLICFSERVNAGNIKHYIQEAERLGSICDRMRRGIYRFIAADTNAIYFYDQNMNRCKADLRRLSHGATIENATQPEALNDIEQLEAFVLANDLFNIHSSLFHKSDGEQEIYVPIMSQAGDNGFHICGDADPMHIGIPSDLPFGLVNICFDTKKEPHQLLFKGLEILHMRLTSRTLAEFEQKIAAYDVPTEYLPTLALEQTIAFKNYLQDPYYVNKFMPLLERTIKRYQDNPQLFDIVGVSSIYSLMIQVDFDHPQSIHGTEDQHPGSTPSSFGAILTCYKDRFVVTSNERSYLAFLLHDPDILEQQRINVHPHWLLERDGDNHCVREWLDLIAIQALHAAQKSPAEFKLFEQQLLLSMGSKRTTAAAAKQKIVERLDKTRGFLSSCSINPEIRVQQIANRIASLRSRYQTDINAYIEQLTPVPTVLHSIRFGTP